MERLLSDDLLLHACQATTHAEFSYHTTLILRKKITEENSALLVTLELLHPPFDYENCLAHFLDNLQRMCAPPSNLHSTLASGFSASSSSSCSSASSSSFSPSSFSMVSTDSLPRSSDTPPSKPCPPPPPPVGFSRGSASISENKDSAQMKPDTQFHLPPPSLLSSSSSTPLPAFASPPSFPALPEMRDGIEFRCLVLLALALHFMGYTQVVVKSIVPYITRLSPVAVAIFGMRLLYSCPCQ